MKKVLALLLVCMLPFAALAETYGVSISIDTDETLFSDYLKSALAEFPDAAADPQLDLYMRLIQQLLDGVTVDVAVQEDAVSVALQIGGGTLLDAIFYEVDDQLVITSSLLQGYALTENVESDATTQDAMLQELDWDVLGTQVNGTFSNWLYELETLVTTGQFVGDAYDGGTKCTTWVLSDKDIAALMETILSGDVRDAVSNVLTAMGFDAQNTLLELDAANARVRKENAYQYLVRAVHDDQNQLKGCSVTVYGDSVQLATFSLGVQEKGICIVFGFGVQDQNYWCELTVNARERNNMTFLSGQCMEWTAPKELRFAYVKTAVEPVSNQEWYCNITKSGQRYLWDASLYEGDKADYAYYFSSEGTANPSAATLDCSFSVGDSPYVPLTLKLKAGPVEALPELDATLARCSLSDPADAALLQSLAEQMYSKLLARLMKLIPLDLLLQLTMQ